MNDQQNDAVREIVTAAIDELSSAQINEMIMTPFHDVVRVKQPVAA